MTDVAEVMSKPISMQLLRDEPLLRLSYTGLDGGPRVIPVAYEWDGTNLRFWTTPISAKVRALQSDPRVAIVIDVVGPPMRTLLVRGTAELVTSDGVPAGYLDASHRTMSRDKWADFDAGVRGLYEQMTEITIALTWAKLIDFETTAPSAVEQLFRERSGVTG